jgi:hypothetical protein
VRGNRVRALLDQQPLLTPEEQQKWNPPLDPDNTPPAPSILNQRHSTRLLSGKTSRLKNKPQTQLLAA